ncbi:uncharacterized protein CCOS01_01256 [Colletotrichum costaricense]|uniref:Uncharacterized protein n=1 Tax=Colletotrichum costaricense TaxID=1209916 RepID=A0AAJ0E6W6_9PEZI|nr:uncharacterized protein CCOS01_01256 [Colletotrichum costaricense]KAK1539942.1 hypothetical protein CCOS01_01256 [Colletotrichum costaricense]
MHPPHCLPFSFAFLSFPSFFTSSLDHHPLLPLCQLQYFHQVVSFGCIAANKALLC